MYRAQSLMARLRETGRAHTIETAIVACAGTAIALGFLGISGWLFDSDFLHGSLIVFTTINPATAAALVVGGISVAFAGLGRSRLAVVAALVVMGIAQAKLADLTCGCVPVDRLVFTDRLDTMLYTPSRMAPNTAIAMLFSGLALALIHVPSRRVQLVAQLFTSWVMLTAMFVLVGYAFDLLYFRRIGTYLPMAKPTAMGLIAMGSGIFLLTRDIGLSMIWRDRGPAGTMFRKTLPLLVALPVVAGVLRIWGQQKGFYSEEAGVALQIITNVIITTTLLMVGTLALFRSDLARREREIELRNSEQFNRLVASANPDCISLLDEDHTTLFANQALLDAHGLTDLNDLLGKPYGYRLDPAAKIERDAALLAARDGGVGRFTLCYPDQDGNGERWFDTIISKLPPDHDWPFRYLAISRDISEKREIEDQVRWKASHDDLTHLPNRAQFQLHLDGYVRQAGQEGFALLLLDIDNFKMVNDTLGHDAGDRLLITVAERLAKAVRQGDIVARLAGDEFAVIARDIRTEPGAVAVAERIFESLREPWLYKGRLGECRVSIGASLAPRHGDS
ncbi:MAG TPA: sensor domain-containing diguanylate cyclase, partial [Novosphingobium sp.]